jgi:hypothetical protein
MKIDYVKATDIASWIGRGLAVGLAIWGYTSEHYLLMFTALFVWIGAVQEARAVRYRSPEAENKPNSPTPPTTWTE